MAETGFEPHSLWCHHYILLPPQFCPPGSWKRRARHTALHDPGACTGLWAVCFSLGSSQPAAGCHEVLAPSAMSMGRVQGTLAASAQWSWQLRNTSLPACSDRALQLVYSGHHDTVDSHAGQGVRMSISHMLAGRAASLVLRGSAAPGLRQDPHLMGGWAS